MGSRKRDGIVYSTDPNFKFNDSQEDQEVSLPPEKQQLYIWIDSKGRNGKIVTLVKGFRGKNAEIEELGTALKKYCGTGGSVKDGEIILQGNFRDKVIAFLSIKGYKTKKAGG